MGTVLTSQIRNIALLGHGGSGKTSLAEAMLYLSGNIDRVGNTADGNTVCDYDPEEIKRHISVQTALASFMWNDAKVNVIDTPGFLGFVGEQLQGIRAADAAIIVVDGKAGVEVGTELAWERAEDAGIPKAFFVNKFDDPECRFDRVFTQLHDVFGVSVCPLMIPLVEGNAVTGFINLVHKKVYIYDKVGKRIETSIPDGYQAVVDKYTDMLLEAVAGTSDELMEKFFAGEEMTHEEVTNGIHEGIIHGQIVPVMCGSALKTWGTASLLDIIADSFPRHTAKKVEKSVDGEDIPIEKESADTAIFVFKSVADQFGKMTCFKVMNGTLNNTMSLKNLRSGVTEKIGHIYMLRGKKQIEVDELACGDIGMVAKLTDTATGDTLVSNEAMPAYKKTEYPRPTMTMAIVPKAKGDEDKISTGIARLRDEDQTIRFENNAETKQLLLSGMGDMHLDVIVSRLKSRYNVSVDLKPQKIAYREAIKGTIQAEGKHKKQSGGHGQYGHVRITFSPADEGKEGLDFTVSVVGGAVPKNFYPAVEKGLQESMQKGVLAGYPMVGLKADLYDGSYHDVDSNEMSFKVAANLAYKELVRAKPILLEPVGALRVLVPEAMVGDVMGDLPKRRGSVLGIGADEKHPGYQYVDAEVPKSEMQDYTIALRAMTQGKGRFTYEFTRYDEVPAVIAEKVIAEAKAEKEAD